MEAGVSGAAFPAVPARVGVVSRMPIASATIRRKSALSLLRRRHQANLVPLFLRLAPR